MIKSVGEPVSVGGMTVKPGDMVHMDMHGVVKFPANKINEVLIRAKKLLEDEVESAAFFNSSEFSLEKWKARVSKLAY
jgi:regulator of RNase E activity RraA